MRTPSPESVRKEIDALEGVVSVPLNDDVFFFYDPDGIGDGARKFPIATLVLSNAYDEHSDLGREGIFRLNLGVDKETFLELFGVKAAGLTPDYTALDVIMPHPDYGNSYFPCVLNPDRTMPKVRQLLAKAREVAANRYRSG
jgi:Family of unknown function (DUF6194)